MHRILNFSPAAPTNTRHYTLTPIFCCDYQPNVLNLWEVFSGEKKSRLGYNLSQTRGAKTPKAPIFFVIFQERWVFFSTFNSTFNSTLNSTFNSTVPKSEKKGLYWTDLFEHLSFLLLSTTSTTIFFQTYYN